MSSQPARHLGSGFKDLKWVGPPGPTGPTQFTSTVISNLMVNGLVDSVFCGILNVVITALHNHIIITL